MISKSAREICASSLGSDVVGDVFPLFEPMAAKSLAGDSGSISAPAFTGYSASSHNAAELI